MCLVQFILTEKVIFQLKKVTFIKAINFSFYSKIGEKEEEEEEEEAIFSF